MKVKDLKDFIVNLPDDMKVKFLDNECGFCDPVAIVTTGTGIDDDLLPNEKCLLLH